MRKTNAVLLWAVLLCSACGARAVPVEVGPPAASSTTGTWAGGEIQDCRKGAVPECTTRTFGVPPPASVTP